LETLMGRLIRARQENRLERMLQQLASPRLLILDELGDLPLSREEACLPAGRPACSSGCWSAAMNTAV
jgi:DNA replication protein DnaC